MISKSKSNQGIHERFGVVKYNGYSFVNGVSKLIHIANTLLARHLFMRLLSYVDVGIDMWTKVAIIGPNGVGKSLLLNLIAGDLQPLLGEVRRSQKQRTGRYSQHFVYLLTMEETLVQYLFRLHPGHKGLRTESTCCFHNNFNC